MGLLNFFKNLSAQIKCDNQLTQKDNWQMLGNKMQVLKYNKDIIVQENQICMLRLKDKTCDILECGNYKINEDNLPVLFEKAGFKKFNGKAKKFKIKADVYFAKKKSINYDFKFKKKQTINNIKNKETVNAKVTYNIANLKQLCKFLFLENSVVQVNKYNNLIETEIYRYVANQVNKYKGELCDLEDNDISLTIKQKAEKELYSYGIELTGIKFYDYKNLTKNKHKNIIENKTPIKQIEQPEIQDIENPEIQQEKQQNLEQNHKLNPVQQPSYTNQYSEAMQTGKITITPNRD